MVAAVLGLGVAIGWHLPHSQRGVLAQAALRGNIVYFTFPLILTTYGADGLHLAAVTSTVLIPAMNLLAVAALEAYRPAGTAKTHITVRVLGNPMVIGALLGLALGTVGWKPWGWLATTLNALADLAFPGALLALGAQLEVRRLQAMWRTLTAVSLIKLVVMPALGWWLMFLLDASHLEVAVTVLLLGAPTAVRATR